MAKLPKKVSDRFFDLLREETWMSKGGVDRASDPEGIKYRMYFIRKIGKMDRFPITAVDSF